MPSPAGAAVLRRALASVLPLFGVLLVQPQLLAALDVGAPGRQPPVKLIVDTDMSTDCDDVAALCIAHTLQDMGLVDILAVVHDTGLLQGVGAVSSVNHYFGRDSIPIGAYKGEFGSQLPGAYVLDLVANFSGPVRNYTQVPEAVEVYRAALAGQPDGTVTIASIGFMTVLEELLRSPGDRFSPLSGVDLVAAKVKSIAWMGGYYPSSGSKHEWNFGGGNYPNLSKANPTSCESTGYVLATMPRSVKLIFSGYDVGNAIETGGVMTTCLPAASPCRQAYIDRQGPGTNRQSWDPSVVLLAVFGVPEQFYDRVPGGHNFANSTDGRNVWQPAPSPTNESYVTLRSGGAAGLAAQIDGLLCHPEGPDRSVLV